MDAGIVALVSILVLELVSTGTVHRFLIIPSSYTQI